MSRFMDIRHKLGILKIRTVLIIQINYKIVTEILNSNFYCILVLFNKLLYEKNSNKIWKTKKKSEYTNTYLNRHFFSYRI